MLTMGIDLYNFNLSRSDSISIDLIKNYIKFNEHKKAFKESLKKINHFDL